MDMVDLFESYENDHGRFYRSGGLKRYLEVLQSIFLSIILFVILIFIWVGAIILDCLTQKNLIKYIYYSIVKVRPYKD
jgi:hypothetical protein